MARLVFFRLSKCIVDVPLESASCVITHVALAAGLNALIRKYCVRSSRKIALDFALEIRLRLARRAHLSLADYSDVVCRNILRVHIILIMTIDYTGFMPDRIREEIRSADVPTGIRLRIVGACLSFVKGT
jgi:hypothetical protein